MTREDIVITSVLMALIVVALLVWSIMQQLRQRRIRTAAEQSGWHYLGQSSLPGHIPGNLELLATGPYGIGRMHNALQGDSMWLFDYVEKAVKLEGRNRRLGTHALLMTGSETSAPAELCELSDPQTGRSFQATCEQQSGWTVLALHSGSNRAVHVKPADIPALTRALAAFRDA